MGILCFSCGKKEQLPDGILNEDQMVATLSELYIGEQKIGTLGITRDSLRQVFSAMQGRIFDKVSANVHTHVDDSVFRRSLDYYMARPQTLEMIYTALIDTLNLHEQRMVSSEEKR